MNYIVFVFIKRDHVGVFNDTNLSISSSRYFSRDEIETIMNENFILFIRV